MLTYILTLGLLWLAEIAWLSLDLELALRVLAAGALFWHPIHEWLKGFRKAFILAVQGHLIRGDRILSRRQHALQAAGLMTVFPVLALVGPWWAWPGIVAFYVADWLYTHGEKEIPAGWSTLPPIAALAALAVVHQGPGVSVTAFVIAVVSAATGPILLALPWWRAYRRVR